MPPEDYPTQSFALQHGRRCVVVDVETTGLSPRKGDRVIEVGAVAIEKKQITEEFHTLIHINKPIPAAAREIHGITNEMLIGQPKPEEAYPRFREFIRNSTLVAHNAAFDIGFLRAEFERQGFGLSNPYFCTLKLSRARYPRLRNHRLETVCRHLFGRSTDAIQQHRALADARMTARVWVEMMKR
jgi:DNA polymerase III subunit epsilon